MTAPKILMDKKLRETTHLCVEVMNSKGETWSLGTNSRLPFDENVMLNHSILKEQRLQQRAKANLSQVLPNFSLFLFFAVNYFYKK